MLVIGDTPRDLEEPRSIYSKGLCFGPDIDTNILPTAAELARRVVAIINVLSKLFGNSRYQRLIDKMSVMAQEIYLSSCALNERCVWACVRVV